MSKHGLFLLYVLFFLGCVRAVPKSPLETSKPTKACEESDVAGCQTRCDAGEIASCAALGDIYQRGQAVPKDSKRAAELYRRACDGGDLEACVDAAMRLEGGQDDEVAEALYQKACDGGEGVACYALGLREEESNPKEAAALYQRGCESEAEACQALAELYIKARGVPSSPSLAATFYKKACDGVNDEVVYEGCVALAELYTKGSGVAQDLSLAMSLYQKACDAGFGRGCHGLGSAYANGLGVPIDPMHAESLYSRACQLGFKEDCHD